MIYLKMTSFFRERIIREGGCYHIDFQQLEDNEALRRAATQTVCNLSLSEKFRERYRPGNLFNFHLFNL